VLNVARTWGTTAAERARSYSCDAVIADADDLFRGVDVAAPADITYRRLCHLRVAPYSYDWVDNGGRRSPREFLEGVDALTAGERVMSIFTLVSFQPGAHLTMRLTAPRGQRLFGDIAVSYAVTPLSPTASRLIAKLRVARRGSALARLRFELLAWGDLIMMRKQLLTLARLAERDWRSRAAR
jgi:hypothetical protein